MGCSRVAHVHRPAQRCALLAQLTVGDRLSDGTSICQLHALTAFSLTPACSMFRAMFRVKFLARVLRQLHSTLKHGGVLFSSNPRGANQEGWSHSRYGAFHDLEAWRRYMADAGFLELEHYYRPAGLPCEQQPWLASVWRKPSA